MSHTGSVNTVQVRPATVEDASPIARIYLESAEHHARLDSGRYWIPATESVLARYRDRATQMRNTDGDAITTLLAELDGEVIGFVDAALHRSPDLMHRQLTYCHIMEIAVAVAHQNHGVGERLLTAAEDWGRRHGAQLASLEFLSVNTRAGAFYQQRMGYRVASHTAIKPLG